MAPTTLWGYNASYPGPTLSVRSGELIAVKWINNLVDDSGTPLSPLLPQDTTIHGAGAAVPAVRTVVHVHGANVSADSDGYPEYWFTADPGAPANGIGGPAGNQVQYTYPNSQPAGTLWYHDHALGITRTNVYAGMAGFYLIGDDAEEALNLPSGEYEVPLLIQDRSFYENGQLFYPRGPGDLTDPLQSDPLEGLPEAFPSQFSVVPHFFGNTNLVNGVVWPYMNVEPRKYRLRLLNGSNSRFYQLRLDDDAGGPSVFHQIGTDGGLLPARIDVDELLLGPAERADVIVDFTGYQAGDEILLRNFGPDSPFESVGVGPPADPATTGQVMKFHVVPLTQPDISSLPERLVDVPRLNEEAAVVVRQLTLDREIDDYGRPKLLLNGANWEAPITETPTRGSVEIWEIENFTEAAHPIHLHLTQFQLLDRTLRGAEPQPPAENELGWHDTIVVNRREKVRVIAAFGDFTGLYVWHCHILEHEDHEMMRPFEVVPEPGTALLLALGMLAAASRRRTACRELVGPPVGLGCQARRRRRGCREGGAGRLVVP
jgi:spore coat protein A